MAKRSPERTAYNNAKQRCSSDTNSPNYYNYKGRGIEFRFISFEQFFAELGPRPEGLTLDRKNNDGHYEPGNVRWANRKVQRENSRQTHYRFENGEGNPMLGNPQLNGCCNPKSEEHRRKIGEANKRAWAARKAAI